MEELYFDLLPEEIITWHIIPKLTVLEGYKLSKCCSGILEKYIEYISTDFLKSF